ncbi:sigma-54-dependent transcriptional regulator [Vagococcus sp.]|uniref:sigma-54-dependent transcriptional regulator n=1 Tax=Vagococcus sp. TaxID=1933889 RepID=UPI003F97A4AA
MKKRIDRVYELVKEMTAHLQIDELNSQSGVTTLDVSEKLAIQRSNASKDLNTLVKEGVLDKSDGRPVRYLCKSIRRHTPLSKYVPSYLETTPLSNQTVGLPEERDVLNIDTFKRIIGFHGSMKNPVEQAKASILYPPKGLNCLIVGPTGSGKTYFAHTMFQFAKQHQVVEASKEMVIFNCADYANNPELLMSHLFGHVKGAFTGASEEKEGLLSLADNGFLFLDEVHRLPPEGQEMIFYFMDTGLFAKLGETTKNRKAAVRIICATTEDPSSALLNTFVRRIPITIQLPNFNDRPEKEKIDLVRVMMSLEAKRINRKIILTEDVVKALIGSVTYGNVGQLKSNVQLVTARAFLNHMEQAELIITIDELNDSIKEGLMKLGRNREKLVSLSHYLSPQMVISPNDSTDPFTTDPYELPYNLYDIIGDKAALLKEEGFNQESINHFISTDINVHLKSFYCNHGFTFDTDSKLLEIMDQTMVDTTRKIYEFSRKELAYDFQTNFLYAIGLHISAFLIRTKRGKTNMNQDHESIAKMVKHYPRELEVAQGIKKIIEANHTIEIPESEVHYLTVLLVSLRENKASGQIGIVVACHGISTASSMVQVVSKLLDVQHLRSVDMPLEMTPQVAKEKIIKEVRAVDEGSGVLLLVDMGSLGTFSEDIEVQTGVKVRTVDMVTTATVLEAARKGSLLETNLENLYQSLTNFHGYTAIDEQVDVTLVQNQPKKAIVAICASGQGTAQRMKELLDDFIQDSLKIEITVFPISILEASEKIKKISEKYEIIATTGIAKPDLEVPFIPMESLFSTEGQATIKKIVERQVVMTYPVLTMEKAQRACKEYIQASYTFINPDKILPPLWQFGEKVIQLFELKEEPSFYINLCMHLAGSIERTLRQDSLTITREQQKEFDEMRGYERLLPALTALNEIIKVEFTQGELFYTYELIKNTILNQSDTQ